MIKQCLWTTALWAPALLAGCGSGPHLVPVGGTVTVNGKPLADAEIRFVPDPANAEITEGIDTTGPAGNYKAMHASRSGLAPGKYRVLIAQKDETAANLPADIKDDPYMVAAADEALRGGPTAKPPSKKRSISDEKAVEITASQAVYDFDVKAPVSK